MSVPMHGIYPVTLGDEIFVPGGATRQGVGAVNTVIALRYLPDLVERYGSSTPPCSTIEISVNDKPIAGNAGFAFTCFRAPASTTGALVLGGHQDLPGTPIFGIVLHVAVAAPLLLAEAATNASGSATLPAPVPGNAAGAQFYAQFVWLGAPPCAGGAPLSASDALDVTIR
jgi:hypothetical protein